jgi:branched-chain amino acid transport system permease protein
MNELRGFSDLLKTRSTLLLLGLGIIVPIFLNDYFIHILIMILLYAYLGQCWNILGGYAGQFSFGHAAFFGVGGYISTYCFVKGLGSLWVHSWLWFWAYSLVI